MTIGDRLRIERERLGYSQSDFSGHAKTTKKSQIDYEKNASSPRASYLEIIATLGADVLFIVTGMRSVTSSDELMQSLLEQLTLLNEPERKVVLNVANGLLDLRKKESER